jgi:hypothetical protein
MSIRTYGERVGGTVLAASDADPVRGHSRTLAQSALPPHEGSPRAARGLSSAGLKALASAVVCAVAVTGVLAAQASAAPPAGLSASGRALRNFEALLHATFGQRPVCTYRNTYNFVSGSCSPRSDWPGYAYTFAAAHGSKFHLATHGPPRDAFGVHPIPIRIRGRYVACDRSEHTWLIQFGGTVGFDFACARPQ